MGAAIPRPSVMLWMPKPSTRQEASATLPVASEAPMASPSPRLWRPMPTAMKSASARPSGVRPSRRPAASRTISARTAADPEQRGRTEPADGAFGDLETLADRVEEKEGQEADGEAEQETPHTRPCLAHGGMERQADRHRHDAHHEPDERQSGEALMPTPWGSGAATSMACSNAAPVLVRKRRRWASPATQGKGMSRRAVARRASGPAAPR